MMRSKRKKPGVIGYKGRKPTVQMKRLADDPARPLIGMINESMDRTLDKTMMALSHALSVDFVTLWSAYHYKRKMPVKYLRRLCHFVGMTDTECLDIHEAQPAFPSTAGKKKEEKDLPSQEAR